MIEVGEENLLDVMASGITSKVFLICFFFLMQDMRYKFKGNTRKRSYQVLDYSFFLLNNIVLEYSCTVPFGVLLLSLYYVSLLNLL